MSFCIPVYNNAERARKVIDGLLCSSDTRFEAVIVDDASSDGAQEILSQIHDPRFRYIRNDKNLGAHKNWLKALELGRGEWLYLVMGRDRIFGEHVNRLIEILDYARENNITLLYDGYSNNDNMNVYDGIEAMLHFLAIAHPTGTILDGRIFRTIQDKEYYFTHSDMFPENYLRRDMLLQGKGASIMSGVYSRVGDFYYWDKKSTVERSKNIFDVYYAPRRLTVQMLEIIDMVLPLQCSVFSEADTNMYFKAKFYELLSRVSLGWRGFCSLQKWQEYNGQQVRYVGTLEMLHNIITAYAEVKAHLKAKKTYTLRRQMIMYKCTARRIASLLYQAAKGYAKVILEPLGIWSVLKAIKQRIKKSPA